MLVTVKFEIPHDLQPRIRALGKQLGLPLDIMCVMLLQDGYVTHPELEGGRAMIWYLLAALSLGCVFMALSLLLDRLLNRPAERRRR